jgi:protein-disulfide isomerase/rhodanese-related sulfurtransferase
MMRKCLALGLALLGLFDSLYLLWVYTSPSRPMVCLGTGCDVVRMSSYASLGGRPTPVFGVAGYALLAILIITESLAGAASRKLLRYALLGATGVGFLFSLYLEYLQGFVIHAFCAWCVTSGLVMTALFGLATYDLFRPRPEPDAQARLAELRSIFAVFVAAVLTGVPAFYLLAQHGEAHPPPVVNTEPQAQKLIRPDSHIAGNPLAPVTVVEFGDFECPVCGRAEVTAREVRAKYSSQVRFVFRQFPLIHIHPLALRAAMASECAANQGKFWEAVDKIYSRQEDLSDKGLELDASEIGLDTGQFRKCLQSGATSARVRLDVEDGHALGVNGTPTFFIDQKGYESALSMEEFDRLIGQELASRGLTAPAVKGPTVTAGPAKKTNDAKANFPPPNPASVKAGNDTPTESAGQFGTAPGGFFQQFQPSGQACSEAEAAKKQPTLVTTDQLRSILAGKPEPLFVDVREPQEYAAGRIPGAINIPVDDMDKRWSALPKDRMIVLYESGRSSGDVCAAGRAAGRILLEHGFPFNQVKVYQDGLVGWEKARLAADK